MPNDTTAFPAATRWSQRLSSPLLHLLIITVLGVVAYSDSLNVPFIFDDDWEIKENPIIRDLGGFLSGAGFSYNPRRFVGYLSFALNYRFGGLDVTGYHVVNVAIHLLAGCLVYFMVRLTLRTPYFQRLKGEPATLNTPDSTFSSLLPLLSALLFVLHPIQTQAVTYVVQRFASLASMLYLLSVVFYLRARLFQEEKGIFSPATAFLFVLSAAAAVLAFATKEITATLPFVIMLFEYCFFQPKKGKKMLLAALLVTLVIVPLALLAAGNSPGGILAHLDRLTRETQAISRGDYLLTQFSVIVTYIRLIFLPVRQNLDYDYPVSHSLTDPRAFLSLTLLLALVGLAVYLYHRSRSTSCTRPGFRLISFGILWFFITLSVESSVIPITDVIYEHRLYLPSAGALIALAAAILLVFPTVGARARFAAVSLALGALLVTTWQRNLVWNDPVTFWMDVASKSPRKIRPYNNVVTALIAAGRLDEAIRISAAPLALDPRDPSAHRNLGTAFEKKGLLDEAIVQYRIAVALRPGDPLSLYDLGVAYGKKGLSGQAAECLLQSIAVKKGNPEAYNVLGVVYAKEGRLDDAIAQFDNALHYDPKHLGASRNRAFAYESKLIRKR